MFDVTHPLILNTEEELFICFNKLVQVLIDFASLIWVYLLNFCC